MNNIIQWLLSFIKLSLLITRKVDKMLNKLGKLTELRLENRKLLVCVSVLGKVIQERDKCSK